MAGPFLEYPVFIMNELQEVRLKDDNWTGKTDPAERRRRQNRQHQRAWRRRKQQHVSATQSPLDPAYQSNASIPRVQPLADENVSLQQLVRDHVSGCQRMPINFELPQSQLAFWTALEILGEPQSIFAYWAELRAPAEA